MAKATKTKTAPLFTGRGAKARLAGIERARGLAEAEGTSRNETIANAQLVLGKDASDKARALFRERSLLGYLTTDPRNTGKGIAGKRSLAEKILNKLAMPKAKSIAKGKLGRRTDTQQKMVNAAKQRYSLMLADAGYGNAQGQAIKNNKQDAKTRAPHHNSTNDNTSSDGAKPDATPKPVDKAGVVQHVATQSATLEAFAAKYAALMPAELGAAIKALRSAAIKAEAALK